MSTELAKQYTRDDYIPVEHWGRDHWSTLAYLEIVEVDCKGFQCGYDPRMRSNRRNFRVMSEQCRRPKRTGNFSDAGMAMRVDDGSRLKDSSIVVGHDDWCCIQDMAIAGYFDVGPECIEPGYVLHLSELGRAVCGQLRAHKATGGSFSSFSAAHAEPSPFATSTESKP